MWQAPSFSVPCLETIVRNFLKYLYAIRLVKRAICTYLESPLFAVGAGASEIDYDTVLRLQNSQTRIIVAFNNDNSLDKWQCDVIMQQLDDNDLMMRTALIGRSLKKKVSYTN